MRQKTTTNKDKYIKIIDSLDIEEMQKDILKSTWLDYLLLINSSAGRGWFIHNYSQVAVIILSLLIPLVEKSKLNQNVFHLDLTIVGILGVVVACLTTLNRQLGFERKWRHFRITSELIRNEGDDYFALAGNYEKYKSHQEAFKAFTYKITTFKRNEVVSYLEPNKNKESKE